MVSLVLKVVLQDAENDSKYRDVAPLSITAISLYHVPFGFHPILHFYRTVIVLKNQSYVMRSYTGDAQHIPGGYFI